MPTPTPLPDPVYRQSLKNWLSELSKHDPADARGLLQALGIVTSLVASRVQPGPLPAPIVDEGFDRKVQLWQNCLSDLQRRG